MTQPIHRRTLLRGAGLTLGLPLLESMTPFARSAFASNESVAAAKAPVRMAFIFFPNGVIVPNWKPKRDGEDWKLSPTLEPLASLKSKINVISGLAHDNGRGYKDGAGDHARCASTFLTAARPVKSSSNIKLGVSVDQVAARQLAGKTALASIELGLTDSRSAGSCDSGYSCAYSSNISWRSETQPMPKETTPRMAFERLFQREGNKESRERDFYRKSILDVVSSDAEQMMKRVGQADRRKLDEYFASVRDVETRIERNEKADRSAMPDLEVPYGRVESFREHARLMFDIMALGFQTDTTRIATLMLDTAGGSRSYKEIDVKEGHHQLSHHRDKEDQVEKLKRIDHYLVQQYAYFLERLNAISEGEGTLLDHSMILYGSGISDGNRHRHEDLPIVLAGGAGGKIQTGRYIETKLERPMGNLFLSMLDHLGTPVDSIGDSSGRLTEL